MRNLPAILAFSFWLLSFYPSYAAEVTGMKFYSGMNAIKTEGEYYGLQVGVVPYFGGLKVLWRSGSGRLDSPLLLDAVVDGNSMKVTVPNGNDMFGEWRFSQDGEVLHAVGPRDLRFDLKELSIN